MDEIKQVIDEAMNDYNALVHNQGNLVVDFVANHVPTSSEEYVAGLNALNDMLEKIVAGKKIYSDKLSWVEEQLGSIIQKNVDRDE